MSKDGRLAKQLQTGDKDALRRVYEKYADTLVSIAVSLVNDINTAEDCLHDAFVNTLSLFILIVNKGLPGSSQKYLHIWEKCFLDNAAAIRYLIQPSFRALHIIA